MGQQWQGTCLRDTILCIHHVNNDPSNLKIVKEIEENVCPGQILMFGQKAMGKQEGWELRRRESFSSRKTLCVTTLNTFQSLIVIDQLFGSGLEVSSWPEPEPNPYGDNAAVQSVSVSKREPTSTSLNLAPYLEGDKDNISVNIH